MVEQLAVMRNVRYGVNDRGQVALSFVVYLVDSSAADIQLGVEPATQVFKDAGARDVRELEGRTCVVTDEDNSCRFVRYFKAGT